MCEARSQDHCGWVLEDFLKIRTMVQRETRKGSRRRKPWGRGSQGGGRENDEWRRKAERPLCYCKTTEGSISAPQVLRLGKPESCAQSGHLGDRTSMDSTKARQVYPGPASGKLAAEPSEVLSSSSSSQGKPTLQ